MAHYFAQGYLQADRYMLTLETLRQETNGVQLAEFSDRHVSKLVHFCRGINLRGTQGLFLEDAYVSITNKEVFEEWTWQDVAKIMQAYGVTQSFGLLRIDLTNL